MKVFISQPMQGKAPEEILMERAGAMVAARSLFNGSELEFIWSYNPDFDTRTRNGALKALAMSLNLLADADFVFFARGWEKARGCRIERECAEEYGIPYGAEPVPVQGA